MPLVAASRTAIAVFLAVLITPHTITAQTTQTGAAQGSVTTRDGRAIANATISIVRNDGTHIKSTRSDQYGSFLLSLIPPGLYSVKTSLIGFHPSLVSNVQIEATERRNLTVTLVPAPADLREVVIEATPFPGTIGTGSFSTIITAEERQKLPIQRNANSLTRFVTGSRLGQLYGGSSTQANLYQLDGVTVSHPGVGGSFLLPNVDWLENFTVLGPGAGAEYGNFQGGLVNMVTRSGSNEWAGSIRTWFDSKALTANYSNPQEYPSIPHARTEFNADFSGPIVKDKAWFFLSAQEAKASQNIANANDAQNFLSKRPSQHEQKYYGKLSWKPSDRHTVNVALGFDRLSREYVGLSTWDPPETNTRGDSPAAFYQLALQTDSKEKGSLELRFSGYTGKDHELPYNGRDKPSVSLLQETGQPRFGNSMWTRLNSSSSHAASAQWEKNLHRSGISHNLKIGGEYVLGSSREKRIRNGGLSWFTHSSGSGFDPSNSATWSEIPELGIYATADTGGGIDLVAQTHNSAFYVQNDMRLAEHFAVHAGLRMGFWSGQLTPGHGGGSRGSTKLTPVQTMGLDPRFGATLNLTQDGSLTTSVHWGRFHQGLSALFFDRAPGGNIFTRTGYCDWNDAIGNNRPDPSKSWSSAEISSAFTCYDGGSLFTEADSIDGYRQPHMDEWTLGVEKRFSNSLKMGVTYIRRRNGNILALSDRNLSSNWRPIGNVQVSNAQGALKNFDGEPVVLPVLWVRSDDLRAYLRSGNSVPGYVASDTSGLRFRPDYILAPSDNATRSYGQVQIHAEGNWPKLKFHAAIAISDLSGNMYSVNGWHESGGQAHGMFVEPNLALNSQGRMPNFAPWDFALRAIADAGWGIEAGMFFNLSGGESWTPSLRMDRSLQYVAQGSDQALGTQLLLGAYEQTVFLEPRGSRRLPIRSELDLRLQRAFGSGEGPVVLGIDIFNLFNGSSATAVNELVNDIGRGASYSGPGAAAFRQQPTTIRLSVQYRI